ncbi:MAG TPA: hypothetical protein ENI49_01510 [Thermoplasmatales archaeon]|nr:hypothetical protein [Thermoplasmatales archaeon]
MVIKILNALKINSIKILLALSREGQLKWKEMQENTKLPTATLNRSLSSLQNTNLISKENNEYRLTWIGKLILDRLFLFGLKMNNYPDNAKIESICSEDSLAQDIVVEFLLTILIAIKLRGQLNLDEIEKKVKEKKDIIYHVLEEYSKEGYLEIKNGTIHATKKFEGMELEEIFSM